MKSLPGYTDAFLDPVTGKLVSESQLPNLDYGYIWEGNEDGLPTQSASLLDAKINIRTLFDAKYILQDKTTLFKNSQGLSDLKVSENTPGILKVKSDNSGTLELASAGIDYVNLVTQDQVLMGGLNDIPESRQTIDINNLPNLAQNNVWVGNLFNRPEEQEITIEILPNLTHNKIWIGNSLNRPEETDLNIPIDISNATYIIREPDSNLPNAQAISNLGTGLTKHIGLGILDIATPDIDYATPGQYDDEISGLEDDISGITDDISDVTSDISDIFEDLGTLADLTDTVTDLMSISNDLVSEVFNIGGFFAGITSFFSGIFGDITLSKKVENLSDDLDNISLEVDDFKEEYDLFITNIYYQDITNLSNRIDANGTLIESNNDFIVSNNNRINDLRLNNIPIDGDINLNNYTITNVPNPILDSSVVNKNYVDTTVNPLLNLILEGFVLGGPPDALGKITTTRGPDALLSLIPAGGDVSIQDNRITNLKEFPEADRDAVSFEFLWKLINDEII